MKEEIIKSLLDWNPWLENKAFPQALAGHPREINFLKYLDFKEIKIIEGARRVGKSTLMFQIIQKILSESAHVLYINFDDEVLKKYTLSEVYYAFAENYSIDYLFIDEIQTCKSWAPFLKKLYDLKKLKQIWISGSNSSLIKNEYATLLTGRNISLKFFSLSFQDFLNFKGLNLVDKITSHEQSASVKKLFTEYLNYGAFPEVVLRQTNKKELLINYFEDFLYKDIVARYNVNASKLKDLSLFLASNLGNNISYRNLAKILNLNYGTVVDYLSYFKDVFLFSELYKFDYSVGKQVSNDKKIYAVDVGLAKAISFQFSENKGRMLENLVFLELKRRGREVYLHKKKKECDFILKEGLKIIQALQVTQTLSNPETKQREFDGLIEALSLYDLKKGLILTEDEEGVKEVKRGEQTFAIEIMPIWKWLLG